MYEDFYGFRERPFRLLPDPGYLFPSRQHRLALVHLEYGLINHAGFIVVSGEIGTGKTTLIKALLQRMDPATVVASVFNTTVGPEEFLSLVLQELELGAAGLGRAEKIERLHQFLISCYAKGERVVLIVDEAQNLGLDTLEEMRLLSNLQTDKDYLIQIIMVGQPELRHKLSHPALHQLAQRISVHYHLHPLDREETAAYIRHRLQVSGGDAARDIFSEDALEAVYTYSRGTPRLVNLLCDACLVHGFADEIRSVTASVVEELVGGEDIGGFWALASASAPGEAGSVQVAGAGGAVPGGEGRLEALENQVRELQSSVLTLSRLVQEGPHSDERAPQEGYGAVVERLTTLLEEEQGRVKRLAEERDALLNEIARLSAPPVEAASRTKKEAQPARRASHWSRLWAWGAGRRK